jgi:hypothetical protein
MARVLVAVGFAGILAVAVGAFLYYVLSAGWGWGVSGICFLLMLVSGVVIAVRERRWEPKPHQRVFVDLGMNGEAEGVVVEHHPSPTIPQTTVDYGAGAPVRVSTETLTRRTLDARIERRWAQIERLIP